ncbi:hypothetical protein HJC99_05810 [Candidatus Saccharibacteria bacterium]|nr:hypothetical protein [Candidatus Saccharibacteria bacterium]
MSKLSLKIAVPYVILISSLVGLVASIVLTYDQVNIWLNPGYLAPCTLNPVLSCGSVIHSGLGHVFGVPAPFLGLVMFPALAAFGLIAATGATLKRRHYLALQAAVTGSALFAVWLFWLSLYQIKALCPYCLVTDVAVYTVAWYVTLYNIQQGYILANARCRRFNAFVLKYNLELLLTFFVVVTAFTLHHFWYYYGQHIKL